MTSPFRYRMLGPAAAVVLVLLAEGASPAEYDIVLRGGTIYDGVAARQAIRDGKWRRPTAGLAPGFVQANLVILPQSFASDFR